ncbi:uncharacterized protein LOC130636917 [Hydractinia symbiolongicarpus]|uniref:uncharacterized protein LOC130636917 n=1 Tax=Hydractinia symbiolongicarpus TaxID=13093 RepID=UPI00254AE027|nr:uncharacterized protein LOC130636917 [Hydractinia symbiolongicarpus]
MCKKGRPKGFYTAIGLSNRKTKEKMVPFVNLPTNDKIKLMLEWVLKEKTTADIPVILSGKKTITLEIMQTEFHPKLSDQDNIDLSMIQHLCGKAAWKHVIKNTKIKKWFCEVCNNDLSEETSVGCDGCLCWCHLSCIGRTKMPAARIWFCKPCSVRHTAAIKSDKHEKDC